jgi:hypothetical protein
MLNDYTWLAMPTYYTRRTPDKRARPRPTRRSRRAPELRVTNAEFKEFGALRSVGMAGRLGAALVEAVPHLGFVRTDGCDWRVIGDVDLAAAGHQIMLHAAGLQDE